MKIIAFKEIESDSQDYDYGEVEVVYFWFIKKSITVFKPKGTAFYKQLDNPNGFLILVQNDPVIHAYYAKKELDYV